MMTNAEKIKRAFAPLTPSRDFTKEVLDMTENRKAKKLSRALVSVCVAVILVVAGATAAYAADLGGFRKMVSLWIQGEERSGMMEQVGDGEFVFFDEQGRENHFVGRIDDGSGERGMTLDEMVNEAEMQPHAYVTDGENGSVWLYYRDQKVDITDQVKNGAITRIKLDCEGKPLYVTIAVDGHGNYSLSESYAGYAGAETLFPSGD